MGKKGQVMISPMWMWMAPHSAPVRAKARRDRAFGWTRIAAECGDRQLPCQGARIWSDAAQDGEMMDQIAHEALR
jgi:hypothetical protein